MNFAGDVKVAGEDVASRSHCVILRLCTLRVPETGSVVTSKWCETATVHPIADSRLGAGGIQHRPGCPRPHHRPVIQVVHSVSRHPSSGVLMSFRSS